jgi:hypothetical protein
MKKLEKTIKKLKCQDIIYHYTDTVIYQITPLENNKY